MGHIPEKLTIPEDHFWQYSISIRDTAREPTFVSMIIQAPFAVVAPRVFAVGELSVRYSEQR